MQKLKGIFSGVATPGNTEKYCWFYSIGVNGCDYKVKYAYVYADKEFIRPRHYGIIPEDYLVIPEEFVKCPT